MLAHQQDVGGVAGGQHQRAQFLGLEVVQLGLPVQRAIIEASPRLASRMLTTARPRTTVIVLAQSFPRLPLRRD